MDLLAVGLLSIAGRVLVPKRIINNNRHIISVTRRQNNMTGLSQVCTQNYQMSGINCLGERLEGGWFVMERQKPIPGKIRHDLFCAAHSVSVRNDTGSECP